MEKDIFGFADAIQIDHLNDEQIKTLEEIFKEATNNKKAKPKLNPIKKKIFKYSKCNNI